MEQSTFDAWFRLADKGSLVQARTELLIAVYADREVQRLEDKYDLTYARGEHTVRLLEQITVAEMQRDQALIRCICEIVS